MKKKSIIPFFYGALLIISVLLFSGCREDACKDTICDQGACLEGICECDSLYEGETCSILEREKFLGQWNNGLICGAGSQVYDLQITAGGGEADIVMSAAGPDQLSVTGWVTGSSITIEAQAYGLNVIQGEGGIDEQGQIITLDLEVDYGSGNFVNCVSAMEKE